LRGIGAVVDQARAQITRDQFLDPGGALGRIGAMLRRGTLHPAQQHAAQIGARAGIAAEIVQRDIREPLRRHLARHLAAPPCARFSHALLPSARLPA